MLTRYIPVILAKIPIKVSRVSLSLRTKTEKGNKKRGETDDTTTALPAPINCIAVIKKTIPTP